MNKFNVLFLLSSVVLLGACKKDKDAAPAPPASNVKLSEGLLGYYPFNGNANDESGKGNNGTIFGSATIVADKNGKPNSALSTTGANGVIVNDGSKLVSKDQMTISFDVMQRQTGRQMFVSSINKTTGLGFQYYIGPSQPSDPKVYTGIAKNGWNCSTFYTGVAGNMQGFVLEKESWYTIVFTFQNGAMKTYVNGTLTDQGTAPETSVNVCTNSNFIIGTWWNTDLIGLNGKIDNVRVYDRVLNTDEIKALNN